MTSYLKELSLHIIRLPKLWINYSFKTVFEAALYELSLTDLLKRFSRY